MILAQGKRIKKIGGLFFICLFLSGGLSCHREKKDSPVAASSVHTRKELFAPFYHQQNGRFRILIAQSSEAYMFRSHLRALINAFTAYGWMPEITIPEDLERIKDIIDHLNRNVKSGYIEFKKEVLDFHNMENTSKSQFDRNKNAIEYHTRDERGYVDLILSFGTVSAKNITDYYLNHWDQGLKKNQPGETPYVIPVIAEGISDPLCAELTSSLEKSDYDFLLVKTDPYKHIRQIENFYSLLEFTSLGVLFANNKTGRCIAALDDVNITAAINSFHITAFSINLDEGSLLDQFNKKLENSPDIDAFYFTEDSAFESYEWIFLKILKEKNIPVLCMDEQLVNNKYPGAFLGVGKFDYHEAGLDNAEKIIEIFRGVKPISLNPVFVSKTPPIYINTYYADKYIKNKPWRNYKNLITVTGEAEASPPPRG